MPQLILIQTPAGPRYTLDGRELRNGDQIELVYPDGHVSRGMFGWVSGPDDPVLLCTATGAGPMPDGVNVRWPLSESVVHVDRQPEKRPREMTEYERRVLRHQAKPELPAAGEPLP